MTFRRLLLLSWLIAFSATAAQTKLDTLTVGSETYSNVTLLGANATDLYFVHSAGIANVKLKYLPPELQKRFNYSPRAAADAETKQMEADAMYHTNLAASIADQTGKARRVAAPEVSLADAISDNSLLGKPAPALALTEWVGTKPALQGKYMLVTFWAPWSAACKQTIPELNALQKKFADNLVVVGITTNSTTQVMQMAEPKLEFPSAVDPKAIVSTAANVTSIPSVLLVDPQGVVRYQGHPAAVTEKKLAEFLQVAPRREP